MLNATEGLNRKLPCLTLLKGLTGNCHAERSEASPLLLEKQPLKLAWAVLAR